MEQLIPLDVRKQQILKAVVSDYTETGVPVGSHALATKYLVALSSATIRNELASLVEIGYLLQPHTSAGRIPSDQGYRYYVDFLMEEEELPAAARRQIESLFGEPPGNLEGLLEVAAMALALSTDAVSLVTGLQALSAKMKHVDLVSLEPRHALLILVLEGNVIRQQAIELPADADQETLSALAGQINAELRGLDAAAIGARPPAGAASDPLHQRVLKHMLAFMSAVGQRHDAVVVHDGVRNLLRQPEFGDVERVGQVLEVVEEAQVLGRVLASLELDNGVRMVIGAENDLEQLRACSLVLTTYSAGDTRGGTIGVLGPTRMRYPQVAPRLRYVSARVGQAIDRMLG